MPIDIYYVLHTRKHNVSVIMTVSPLFCIFLLSILGLINKTSIIYEKPSIDLMILPLISKI